MNLEQVETLTREYLFDNYSREKVCFERGEGEILYDIQGRQYLDLVAGIAVNALGHCHPSVVRAVREQAGKLVHVSNLYLVKEQALLAQTLASIVPAPLGRSLFVNSGAEANEAALKLAVKHTGRRRFVAARNSFHGRTSGSLSATGQPKYHSGFEPLIIPGFDFIDYGSAEQLKEFVGPETAAVVLEPIQGEGGIIVPGEEFIRTARDLCTDSGALLVIDEVQTGFGRTGRMFAFEHFGIVPDVVTVAKALGGGFPIGAVISSAELSRALGPGSHGSTFGGSPFVCTAARTVIETIESEGLVQRSERIGERFISDLRSAADHEAVKEVRGKGLMIGVEMGERAKALQRFAFERGVLVNVCAGSVVRLVPPLVVQEASLGRFKTLFAEFLASLA